MRASGVLWTVGFVGVLTCVSSAGAQTFPTRYVVRDLGAAPSGYPTTAIDINVWGHVCGWSYNPGNPSDAHAFLWDGEMHWLSDNSSASRASALNDSDLVVGHVGTLGTALQRACFWSGGTLTFVGPCDPSYDVGYGTACGVANDGRIVGGWTCGLPGQAVYHAFIRWPDGTLQEMDSGGAWQGTRASAINEGGLICGSVCQPYHQDFYAMIWWPPYINHWGGLPSQGVSADATWLNNSGQIVGYLDYGSGVQRAVLWDTDTPYPWEGDPPAYTRYDLPILDGGNYAYPIRIDNSGVITGFAKNSGENSRAVAWVNRQIIDLNTCLAPNSSGWTLTNAAGRNTAGQIAATGQQGAGPAHALVLTPVRLGDLNCDGSVNFGDINPFVLHLANFSTWQATYPGCPPESGDINWDGTYSSFGDINPFVALLSRG